MMEERTQAELEALSAYLDGELPEKQRISLEARLLQDEGLQAALDRLRRTRAFLRTTPAVIRKRSFTLTPEMAAAHARPARLFPAIRLVSALATILFVVLVGGDLAVNLLLPGMRGMGAVDNLAAAPEVMEMESPVEEAMPAAAADSAEEAVQEAAPAEADGEMPEEETSPTETSAAEDRDGDGIPDELDDDDLGDQAEEHAPLMATPPPPIGFAQGGGVPDQSETPGIGGGAPDAGEPQVTETPTPVEPTATPQPTPTEAVEEQESAMMPPAEGEQVAPKIDEAAMEEVEEELEEEEGEERPPDAMLMMFLRIAEVLLALMAVAAGIWAWRLRRT